MAKKTSKKRVHSGKAGGGSARASKKVVRRQTSKKKSAGKRDAGVAPGAASARAVDALLWSHGLFGKLVGDWPQDKWTYQSAPTDSHALWTLGHLATAYSWFTGLLTGTMLTLPENYNTLFGYGSKPVDNPGAYPSAGEVKAACERAWNQFVSAAKALKDGDLTAAPAMDAHGLAKDKGEVLRLAGWHDGWHMGQLSSLRKALGMPGVM